MSGHCIVEVIDDPVQILSRIAILVGALVWRRVKFVYSLFSCFVNVSTVVTKVDIADSPATWERHNESRDVVNIELDGLDGIVSVSVGIMFVRFAVNRAEFDKVELVLIDIHQTNLVELDRIPKVESNRSAAMTVVGYARRVVLNDE